MANEISLRAVQTSDLEIFFEQQRDPCATTMAAFPARPRNEFMAHWAKIMQDETTILRSIVVNGHVAGNIIGWGQPDEPKVGYWLGQEYWGRGIASAALSQFLLQMNVRPLFARVAKTNVASIRVLQKCGFTLHGEDTFTSDHGEVGEEFIMVLGAHYQSASGGRDACEKVD